MAANVVAAIGSWSLPFVARAQEGPGRGPADGAWPMMHDWGWGSGGMFLGPLFMLVWLAILVAVIVLVVRWLAGGPMGAPNRTPREILDERFAKGEIDHEEYEKRRKTLGV